MATSRLQIEPGTSCGRQGGPNSTIFRSFRRIDGVSSGGYRRGGGEWLRRACGDDSDVEI